MVYTIWYILVYGTSNLVSILDIFVKASFINTAVSSWNSQRVWATIQTVDKFFISRIVKQPFDWPVRALVFSSSKTPPLIVNVSEIRSLLKKTKEKALGLMEFDLGLSVTFCLSLSMPYSLVSLRTNIMKEQRRQKLHVNCQIYACSRV